MPNGKCPKCGQAQWVDTQSFIDSNHTKLRMTCGAHDEWVLLPEPELPVVRRRQQFKLPMPFCVCGCGQRMEDGRDYNAKFRRDCKRRIEQEREARRKR